MKRAENGSDKNSKKVKNSTEDNKDLETKDEDFLDFKTGECLFKSFLGEKTSLETFLNEYWEKKPLLIKRSQEPNWVNYTKQLFSLDILKEIVQNKKIKYEQDLNLCRLVDDKKKVFNKKGVAKLDHVLSTFDNEKATIQFHQPQRYCVIIS